MADLTQYGASPYADPKNRTQVQGALASALRGFLGREEQGSVLEPGAQEARSTNNLGQGAAILSDLFPYGAAAKAAKAAGGIVGMSVGQGAKTWEALAAAKTAELLRKGSPATKATALTNTISAPGVEGDVTSSISLLDLLRNAPEPKPLGLHDEYDFRVNPKDASVYVYRKGEPPEPGYANAVGWVGAEPVGGGKYWAEDVLVDKKHGKKGIATEMYQQLLDAGVPLVKSNDVTPEGQKMWAAWHKKGLAKNNEFIGKSKSKSKP